MKKTIKVTVNRKEVVEKEFEFPIFREAHVGDEYSSTYYSRIEEDGSQYTIHESSYYRRQEFEVSIQGPGFPSDFGESDYEKSSETQFDFVLWKLIAFIRRFPGYSEDEEIAQLRSANAELKQKIELLDAQLRQAKKTIDGLEMIHADVKKDVERYGVGYTIHVRGKGMDRLPPEVIMLKGATSDPAR